MTIPVLASAAAAAVSLAVHQAESAVRVRDGRRGAPPRDLADSVAGATAGWEAVDAASSDGLRLRAWLFRPRHWNGRAAIVLHGFTGSRLSVLDQARLLVEAGFAVLAPDSRGHGESGGAIVSFGIHEQHDLRLWGDFLCGRLRVGRYSVLGESMGAAVALQTLASDERIDAAVADAPFALFEDVAVERFADRIGVPPVFARTALRPVLLTAWNYIRLRYGIDLRQARPIDAMSRTSKPVLLIHGSADPSISPRHSERLHAANPAASRLWIVPGAGHAESVKADPRGYRDRVLAAFGA
ncbi:MAG: alpha/beta fold hydrolase [Bryobacteraceae bacterium]